MKKIIKRASAALLSTVILLSCTAALPSSDPSLPQLTGVAADEIDYVEFDNINDAADYFKEQLRNRNVNVNIKLPYSFDEYYTALDLLFKNSLSETGVPDEGDYMRYGLHGYKLSYQGNSRTVVFRFTLDYFTNAEQERFVDKRVKEIVSSLALNGKTEYEKIKAIFNYIVKNVSYDSENKSDSSYSAYGALFNGKAVCQGYTQLFYRLATESGISCRIVAGTSEGANHTWVIAGIDGLYYLIDPTWDSIIQSKAPQYFLKGKMDFDESTKGTEHTTGEGKSGMYSLYPDYTSVAFNEEYPIACSAYSVVNDPKRLKLGDVDLDGKVTSKDAAMTLRASVELSSFGKCHLSEIQMKNADMMPDGILRSDDAARILRYTTIISSGSKISAEQYVENPF